MTSKSKHQKARSRRFLRRRKTQTRLLSLIIAATTLCACRTRSKPSTVESAGAELQSTPASIVLAKGYNSIGGIPYSRDLSFCVVEAPIKALGGSVGEDAELYIGSAIDEKSLDEEKSKSIGGGISYSTPIPPASEKSSDSAKPTDAPPKQPDNPVTVEADMTRNSNSYALDKSRSIHVVVRGVKLFAAESMNFHNIRDNVLEYFSAHPDEFFSKCGDRFVSGVVKGASITAVLSCEANSSEHRNRLNETVKAKGGYMGVGVNASAESIISTIRKETSDRCNLRIWSAGGSGSFDGITAEQVMRSAVAYLSAASPTTAKVIEFETMPYSAIISLAFQDQILKKTDLELTKPRNFCDQQKSIIKNLSQQIDILTQLGQGNAAVVQPLQDAIEKSNLEIDTCIRNITDEKRCGGGSTLRIKRF